MKKKLNLQLFVVLFFSATIAFAQWGDTKDNKVGGYVGPTNNVITSVAQAKELRDDTPVMLNGKITNHLGNNKYTFEDGTGSIIVEIDKYKWRGVSVGANDTVQITGEVDKDKNSVKIDVDFISK